MIALAGNFYHYKVVYCTRGAITPRQSGVIQHLMNRISFLESEQGMLREPHIPWDVSLSMTHSSSPEEFDKMLSASKAPAVVIFDESVTHAEVESYRNRLENRKVFVLRVTDYPDPKLPALRGNVAEITPQDLTSTQHFDKKKLNDNIVVGVMYNHHHARKNENSAGRQ